MARELPKELNPERLLSLSPEEQRKIQDLQGLVADIASDFVDSVITASPKLLAALKEDKATAEAFEKMMLEAVKKGLRESGIPIE